MSYLAETIRAVADDPTPEALRKLRALAVQIERMERCLDDIVGDAHAAAQSQPKRLRS